jgi:hypothetical protein
MVENGTTRHPVWQILEITRVRYMAFANGVKAVPRHKWGSRSHVAGQYGNVCQSRSASSRSARKAQGVTVRGRGMRQSVIAVVVVMFGVGVTSVGVAHADPTLVVTPSTGLTDGQQVTITVSGLTPNAQASVEVSECGNAYADNSSLATVDMSVGSRDCAVLAFTAPGALASATSAQFQVPIHQTGIGAGNRSCVSTAPSPCVVYISQSVNEGSGNPSSDISFALDPTGAAAAPTTTSAVVNGSPLAISKPAVAHLTVHRQNDGLVPEGSFTVDLDGAPLGAPSVPVSAQGTADIALAGPNAFALHSTHTVVAHFAGNGSFASSDSATASFSIVADTNISVGDASVVEGDSGTFRKVVFPVVLSRPASTPVTLDYVARGSEAGAGTATLGSDFISSPGKLSFKALGPTVHYIVVKINPDSVAGEGDETFSVVVSNQTAGWDLRRPVGTGTILDDDASPPPSVTIDVGSAAVPEGDTGGVKALKFPVTLSAPAPSTFCVTLIAGFQTATHGTKTSGDWGGGINKKIRFLMGQVTKFVSVPTFSDTSDEVDETLSLDVAVVHDCNNNAVPGVVVRGGHGVGTILTDE